MKNARNIMTYLGLLYVCYFVYQVASSGNIPDLMFAMVLLATLFVAVRVLYVAWQYQKNKNAKELKSLKEVDVFHFGPWLKENIKGHDDIIDSLLKDLDKNITMEHPDKPVGAYFFIGPTGTGKTYLSTLLSEVLYEKENFLYYNLAQYKDESDGKIVLNSITEKVIENPRRVILLDEIDKCNREVTHVLYQILDGAVSFSHEHGKSVNFHSCLFLATSNFGADKYREIVNDKNIYNKRGEILKFLGDSGRFEKSFLARWDNFYLVDKLTRHALCEVAILEFVKHWRKFNVNVNFVDPEVIINAIISNERYSEYGVREFQRVISDLLEDTVVSVKKKGYENISLEMGDNNKIKAKVLVHRNKVAA